MARNPRFLVFLLLLTVCKAAIFQPISDRHRSAALELFVLVDGSFGSLEDTYEALKTLTTLGIDKNAEISQTTCPVILETITSQSFDVKDVFYALRVNSILGCNVAAEAFEGVVSQLKSVVKDANSVLEYYYSIGSLVLIKGQGFESVAIDDADGIFHSIKSLSQSDGRWRNSNGAQPSAQTAGIALEALAGVVSLASSEVDQSVVGVVKNDITKLFDSLESYDDGALFFDEKLVDSTEHQGPLSTTSAVIHGITAFAEVTSGKLNIPGDKILGLAYFFLGIGIPGTPKDLFNQIDALACLENNRIAIPLIVSLPATVLSLSSKDQLKVKVNTVLGSGAPPLTVNLVKAFRSGSKNNPALQDQKLTFSPESSVHSIDVISKGIDVGKFTLVFQVVLHDPEHKNTYTFGDQTQVTAFVTGIIKIDNTEISVLDNDVGSIETKEKLDLSGMKTVSLSASHLQKLRLSFNLATPLGNAFVPHQVFLKLKHESNVEHMFVLGNSGKQFDITLDFLGLVEKFYYLSGRYDIQLTVGDALMENSFFQDLGHVELDLPEPPEKAPRSPPQPVDPYSRFGPKSEISHIFRAPEKRPPKELSLAFLALTTLPFIGFLIGLIRLKVNLKNFPTSAVPATFAFLFHAGIGAVLLLYTLFWLKLDLFTTLKALGFLGVFLVFVGHRTLSHLASTSAKQKTS